MILRGGINVPFHITSLIFVRVAYSFSKRINVVVESASPRYFVIVSRGNLPSIASQKHVMVVINVFGGVSGI